jgi:capsular exopolysaccharide synthesis family protein
MDPAELTRAIRRRWPIVALTVLAALVAGWLTTTVVPTGPPVQNYEATTVILSDANTSFGFGTGYNLRTIAALATVGKVPERAAEEIGWQGDPLLLAQKIRSSGNTETGILRISASSTDPEEARLLADTFAEHLVTYWDERTGATSITKEQKVRERIKRLETEAATLGRQIGPNETGDELLVARRNAVVSELTSLYQQQQQAAAQSATGPTLTIIQPAVPVPVAGAGFLQVRSLPSRLLLAAFLGLLAGVGLVYLREKFDTRIHTKESAEQHFDLPVLAEIPYVRGWRRRSSVAALSKPKSPVADSFRLLAAGIMRRPPTPPQAILVTGPGPGEGKSTVVANLAGAFAEVGKKVLILSCDLHRPTIHTMFGVPNSRGLTDALKSQRDGHAIVNGQGWRTAMPSVRLVPSGIVPEKPGELLSSPLMRHVIAEAREAADIVLIDTAPILAASDATHLFPLVDAVLVVGRAGRTTALSAQRSSELLLRLGAPVVGAALNGSTEATLPRGYYSYYADNDRRARGRKSRRRASTMVGLTGDQERA